MTVAVPTPFVANDEVDGIRWLPPDAAAQLLSYPRDADVVASFASFASR
jgi:hypothetical protein